MASVLLAIGYLGLGFIPRAAADLTHTISASSDVAVTANGYTASGPLNLSLGFSPTPGLNLTVIRNTGTSFINGTFSGVPQGAIVPLTYNGVTYPYIANYHGERGRSLVLQWPLAGIWAWGSDEQGALGNGNRTNDLVPTEVVLSGPLAGKAIIATATGADHTLALTADGKVFAWGSNAYGALGNTSINSSSNFPVPVDTSGALSGKTVVAIDAGDSRSLALTSDGVVFAWGYNSSGQVGDGTTVNRPLPVAVNTAGALAGKTVIAISGGYYHSLALTSEGKVYGWGYNFHGELGNNSITNSPVPIPVDTSGVLNGKTVVDLGTGLSHSLAVTSEGQAIAWGFNQNGELGNNSTSPSPVPVAVTSSGALSGKILVEVEAGYAHSVALTSDGTMVTWGLNSSGETGTLVPVTEGGSLTGQKVIAVAAGNAHSMALTEDGQPHVWGSNGYRQLGNNDSTETSVLNPTPVGSLGPAVGKAVGAIEAGNHQCFAISDMGPPTLQTSPVNQVASVGATVQFTASAQHPFPSTIRWQESPSGLAGPFTNIVGNPTASTPTLSIEATSTSLQGRAYRAVFSNSSGSATSTPATLSFIQWSATLSSDTMIPFEGDGIAVSGTLNLQLAFTPAPGTCLTVIRNSGPGFISGKFSNVPHGGVVPLAYNGVTYHFVANYYGGNGRSLVLQWPNMKLVGWGYSSSGQLGDVGSGGQDSPVMIPAGSALTGKTLISLATGHGHVLALTADGKVFAWGENSNGQLGNNSTTDSSTPVAVSGALATKTVVAIAANTTRSLALTSDGRIYLWGERMLNWSTSTNLLVPTALNTPGALAGKTVTALSAGRDHDLALCSDGEIVGWGSNTSDQLGAVDTSFTETPVLVEKGGLQGKTVVAIAAGAGHSLALTRDGKVYGWGDAFTGALGNNSANFTEPLPVAAFTGETLAGKQVTAISAATDRSMVLCDDGRVYASGRNWEGELGNGTTASSQVPVAVDTSGVLAGKSVTAIGASSRHSLALTSDGWVHAWGSNDGDALGNNGGPDSAVPVVVDRSGVLAGRRVTSFAVSDSGFNVALAASGGPIATRPPLDQLASSGDTVTFSADAMDYLSVRWQVSTGGASGPFVDIIGNATATAPQLVLTGVTAAQDGSAYRAVFTNAVGVATSTTATLEIANWAAVFHSPSDLPFESQRIKVSGTIALQLDFAPEPGTNLTVIRNTGPGLIEGRFDNLAQGQQVTLAYGGVTYDFIVNYHGGSGRSLVLQWSRMKLATWGSNNTGQLGNGTTNNSTTPVALATSGALSGKALLAAAAGDSHGLAVDTQGKVYGWGANSNGQLGINSTTSASLVPLPVIADGVLAGKSVVSAAAGPSHSLAVTTDGRVFAWGSNLYGMLGSGSTSNAAQRVPVAVSTDGILANRAVTAIAAGDGHSLALTDDGKVVAWGNSTSGRLGSESGQDSRVPVAVDTSGVLASKCIVAIAAGESHSLALSTDGKVYAWGSNGYGQLGIENASESRVPAAVNDTGVLAGKTVIAIAAGARHSLALTSDGLVFGWGYNWDGQLGNGTTGTSSSVPVAVNTGNALAGKFVVTIAARGSQSFALTSDGQLCGWGLNFNGRLGTTPDTSVPVVMGLNGILTGKKIQTFLPSNAFVMAMFAAPGTPEVVAHPIHRSVIFGSSPESVNVSFSAAASDPFPFSIRWQESTNGETGPFSDITDNPTATTGTLTVTVASASMDGRAYRAVFSNVAGDGPSFPASLSVTSAASPLTVTSGTDVPFSRSSPQVSGDLQIALGFAPVPGSELTLIRNNGMAFISGEFSNLPQGATVPLSFGGITHSYVVNYFGGNGRSLVLQWARTRATNWGLGEFGLLGNGGTSSSPIPVAVNSTGTLAGKTVFEVAGGSNHSLALTSDGKVHAWGLGGGGQLGNGSTSSSNLPVAVDATGVLAGRRIVAIDAGETHSLALSADGLVFAWGNNVSRQLGNGGTTSSPVPVAVSTSGALAGKTVIAIAAGNTHNLALTSDGIVTAWGTNGSGQLGDGSFTSRSEPVEVWRAGVLAGKTVVAIAAGNDFSLVLTSDGRLYSWGSNSSLQLGVSGGPGVSSSPLPVAAGMTGVASVKTFNAIAAGTSHAMALATDGVIYSWGLGSSGQLGNGLSVSTSVPVSVVTNGGVLAGKTITGIAAGITHSLALTSDGKVYAWGSSSIGQLGNNTYYGGSSSTPIAITTTSGAIGSRSTIALTAGPYHSLAICGLGVSSTVTQSPSNQTIRSNSTVSFTATVEGGYPASTVRWQQSATGPGGLFSNITNNASATTNTLVLTNVTTSRNGYAYRAVFNNVEGDVPSSAATLTVIPPPQITVPANITATATHQGGCTVEFSVTAQDNLDGVLIPTCTPASGSTFPIGTTTVQCSVTNSLGSTSTASFTITVKRSFASFLDEHGISDPDAQPPSGSPDYQIAYAFGIDPAAPDLRQLPKASVVDGHLRISYPRWKDSADLNYVVQLSDNLVSWQTAPGSTREVSVTPIDPTREQVVVEEVTPIGDTPRRYMRILLPPQISE